MKRSWIFILLGVLLFSAAYSKELTGYGLARSEKEAKELAMADLSSQIEVEVDASFSQIKSVNNGYIDEIKEDMVRLESRTSLYGVEYRVKKSLFRKKYRVYAVISQDKLGLYEAKISELKNSISEDYKKARKFDDILLKRAYVEKAIESRKKYDSYAAIAFLLGSDKSYRFSIGKIELEDFLNQVMEKLNKKRVVYVRVRGNLGGDSKKLLESAVKKMLVEISRKNGDRMVLSEVEDEEVNTVFTVEVNSFHINRQPDISYNKKVISSEKYLGYATMSMKIYSKTLKTTLLDLSVSSNGADLKDAVVALNNAVLNGVKSSRAAVEENILREK